MLLRRILLAYLLVTGILLELKAQESNTESSLLLDLGLAIGSGVGSTIHGNFVMDGKGTIVIGYTGLGAISPSDGSKRSRSFSFQYGRLFRSKGKGYTIISLGPSFGSTGYYQYHNGGWWGGGGYSVDEVESNFGIQLDCKFVGTTNSPTVCIDIFLNYNSVRSFGGISFNLVFGKLKSE